MDCTSGSLERTERQSKTKGNAMLVLSRQNQEELVIGDGDTKVVIRILRIDRRTVRLGITAANRVNVYRKEIGPKEKAQPKND